MAFRSSRSPATARLGPWLLAGTLLVGGCGPGEGAATSPPSDHDGRHRAPTGSPPDRPDRADDGADEVDDEADDESVVVPDRRPGATTATDPASDSAAVGESVAPDTTVAPQ